MSTMRYRRFMAWTVPACVIWAFAYVTVGWLAAGSYREVSRELHWAGYVFVGVIALFLIVVWGAKKLIMRVESRHMSVEHASPDHGQVAVGADPDDEGPDAEASDPSGRERER
jgi:membrane-associated protein